MIETVMYNLAAFIVVLSFIVFIHEFGHYIVAKLCGVKILAFSIGFGKELFGITDKSGTRWKVSLWPLGGYVQMYGDSNAASTATSTVTVDESKTFYAQSLPKRAAIVAAGPIANILLSIVIMTFFFFSSGAQTTPSIINDVIAGGPAQIAGIKGGDLVTDIDGHKIKTFNDIVSIIALNTQTPVKITVNRAGKLLSFVVTPKFQATKDMFGNNVKLPVLGIGSTIPVYTKLGLTDSIVHSVHETKNITDGTFKAVGQIVTGDRSTKELSGPIGIAKYSGQSAKLGISTVFWFIAILSINLGLMNILPVPGLDGGHLFFYAIEAVIRKPLPVKMQEIATKVGIAIILALGAFAIFNDIRNLF